MFFVLFVIVGSRLVGKKLPLFVAMFGKLCMYYSGVLQVWISRLLITARLRGSVSCILSLSLGRLSVFIFLALGAIWKSVVMFSSFCLCNSFRLPLCFFLFLCYLERDFSIFVVRCVYLCTFLAVFACQSLMFRFLRYVRLAIGYFS